MVAQKLRTVLKNTKILSAAVSSTPHYGNNFDPAMHEILDWIGIMTYDLTGSWDRSPVGPHSALKKITNQSIY
jgi:GH18 family chitinase